MLGVAIEHPRRMMSDRVWEQLKAALEEAKHSRAGAPAELSDRESRGLPLAGFTTGVGHWHAVYMRFRRWE